VRALIGAPTELVSSKVANKLNALAKLGWSDAIAAKLKEEESVLVRLRAERSKSKPERGRPLPTPRSSRRTSTTCSAS
jgi:hypothetical protein